MERRARRSLLFALPLLVLLAIPFAGCGKDKGTNPVVQGPTAAVKGFVQDADTGTPIAAASVKASSGATATTDVFGKFSLNVAANQAVRVDVSKAGFSLNQLVVNLAPGTTKSYAVGLLAAGTTSSVTVSSGGAVTDANSNAKLTLPAGFVTAAGSVNVTVTGLDPTTSQIKALPGGLEAIDGNGQPVYLSPVSFAEYTVKDAAGNVLQFNPSASQGADIELPIPVSLQGQPGYQDGDPIECYVYDPADGKWKTPVPGVIGPSSVDGQPAIKATIFHLSWYGGAPAASDVGCITGTVTLDGVPLAGVDVEAFPGGNAVTDAQGNYQVQAALNREVRVVATQAIGSNFRQAEATVQVGSTTSPCIDQDLALGALQAGSFLVEAALLVQSASGVRFEVAGADVALTQGKSSVPVTTATVQLGFGNTWFTLANEGGGTYLAATGTGNFDLVSGTVYTLRVDFESDGSWDASGNVRMVGLPAFTNPSPDETVPAAFTATWTDDASGVAGYTAQYFGHIFATDQTGYSNAFITDNLRSYDVGTGAQLPFPNDPLPAGDFDFALYAFNGFSLTDTTTVFNITGPNATGVLGAIGFAEDVSFHSSGAGATKAIRYQAVRMPRAIQKFERLEADWRKAAQKALRGSRPVAKR